MLYYFAAEMALAGFMLIYAFIDFIIKAESARQQFKELNE